MNTTMKRFFWFQPNGSHFAQQPQGSAGQLLLTDRANRPDGIYHHPEYGAKSLTVSANTSG